MQEQKLYGHRDGAVAHIVFNNPAKLTNPSHMSRCAAWS